MGVARSKRGPTGKKMGTAGSKRVVTYQPRDKQKNIVVFNKPSNPTWIGGRIVGGQEHFGGTVVAGMRKTEYQGHRIRIKTSYEITVDGVPFQGHAVLDADDRICSHACPYQSFDSMLNLMKHLIDLYPESFQERDRTEEYPAETVSRSADAHRLQARHK